MSERNMGQEILEGIQDIKANKALSHSAEFLSGQRIYLRPVEPGDIPSFYQWANASETRRLTGEVRPSSYAETVEYYEKMHKEPDRAWFAVVVRETQQLIGETGLLRMFPSWRTTDWSIIIGEHDARGQGFGTETALLMLNYAFGALNFHRVSIGVVGFNQDALHFYEKLGFQREGVQRDGYYYAHRYHEFVMMSLLEDEFRLRWPEQ